jgi:hypothetical protein
MTLFCIKKNKKMAQFRLNQSHLGVCDRRGAVFEHFYRRFE